VAQGNLPHPLTSFVGRRTQIRQIGALVASERLITLVGPGGCGKSRLGLQVAAAHAATFPDGVFVVELAPIGTAPMVPRAVADALAVTVRPRRDMAAQISDALRTKHVLLILDNCEHVAAEMAGLIDSLLRGCPRVHVLATSRIALGVAGERVWSVPPMTAREAIELFGARAAMSAPGHTEPSEADAVEICGRLDGMPLAIELAAARLKTLSPSQLAARLTNRFDVLTTGDRQAQPRQRTLIATMDWSYELLSREARTAWRFASVFVGGFGLEAIESVSHELAAHPSAVLDAITELVDNSIVSVPGTTGDRRFQMLETVREYGLLKLAEAGEDGEAESRHLRWFVALGLRAEPEWRGPNQQRWLGRVTADLGNIRAALEFGRRDPAYRNDALRLASSLWLGWQTRHASEGRMWLERLLDGATDGRARAYGLNVAGFLAYVQGDSTAAVPLLEESVRVSSAIGEPAAVNLSVMRYGIALLYDNRLAESVEVLTDAVARYRKARDRIGIYVAAYELAEALTMIGDYEAAWSLHRESLVLKQQQGDRWHIALSHFGIGLLEWMQGAYDSAVEALRQSLTLRRDLDEEWGISKSLEGLGWVEISRGRCTRGLVLLGASSGFNERLGIVLSKNYQVLHDRSIGMARKKLGEVELRTMWRQGGKLSVDDAIAYALGDERGAPSKSKPRDAISKREHEVAGLIAGGMTNRSIARRLGVAERTIDAHVEHLMNKLGYRSRSQIAAWVTSRGSESGN